MTEISFQEQAFAALYLDTFNAFQSAVDAGYSESYAKSHAWKWVSLTACPVHKQPLYDHIQKELTHKFGEVKVDKMWVLKRAKLLADFNIRAFLVEYMGDMVYDFSTATGDDWYCIEEYLTEQSYREVAQGEPVPVDKLKIKTGSKVAALKLLGDHIEVQAFKENLEVSGEVIQVTMTAEDYKKARSEAMVADDC